MPASLTLPGYNLESKVESRDATILIGYYTFCLHLLAGFYFLDVFRGSESDWEISPLFEYSTDSVQAIALLIALYCFTFMIVASLGLVRGVKQETRIYYWPWLILTLLELIVLYYQSAYLIWRYSYDGNTIFLAVVLLLFTFYHMHLYLVVWSNYRYLKRIQSPTLIFPTDI